MSTAPATLPHTFLAWSAPAQAHNAETTTMTSATQRSLPGPSRLHQEAIQFRIILAATYPFFLAAALVHRALPTRQYAGYAPQRRSVFGEAKAMAVSAIPFAFMG